MTCPSWVVLAPLLMFVSGYLIGSASGYVRGVRAARMVVDEWIEELKNGGPK